MSNKKYLSDSNDLSSRIATFCNWSPDEKCVVLQTIKTIFADCQMSCNNPCFYDDER